MNNALISAIAQEIKSVTLERLQAKLTPVEFAKCQLNMADIEVHIYDALFNSCGNEEHDPTSLSLLFKEMLKQCKAKETSWADNMPKSSNNRQWRIL